MAMINKVKEFATKQGIKTAYEFAQKTEVPESTAHRLFRNRNNYPSKQIQELICKKFRVQPGEFLGWEEND
jgi:transcriptional regulator with XRE-family HTH domain